MNLELFILGCGGMMPLPGRHLTSVLLRREGDLFLFDCGEATQISLKKLNLRWKKINVILISHMHADHVTGLPGILMLSSQVDRDEPLYIIGPPKIREYIEETRRILDMYINYSVEIIEVLNPGTVFKGDGYSIEAFSLNHTKPCFGYSFTEDPRPGVFYPEKAVSNNIPKGKMWALLQSGVSVELEDGRVISPETVTGDKRRGRKMSYVTDTAYLPEISEQVADSDVLICEGMFTEDLSESAAVKKHLTASQAGMIAANAGGIGKMGLIHYSPRYSDREIVKLLEEARAVFPDTFLTRDRQVFKIKYKE